MAAGPSEIEIFMEFIGVDQELEANVFDQPQQQTTDTNHQEVMDEKSAEVSVEFVGLWSKLISTTNWEKGKIISQWRQALVESEAPAGSYSDESWSRIVGGVTSQHVGRLRRVFDRFGESYTSYEGLFWSHFLAAMDWHDAEMWLEGAVQSGWSVSQMRRAQWEANGGKPEDEPNEAEVAATSVDEDFTPLAEVEDETNVQDGTRSVAEGPRYEDPDFGDEGEDEFHPIEDSADDDDLPWNGDGNESESPFAKLPSLPVDIAEATEAFKLAIIRHRSSTWSEVSQKDVLSALDALKIFTLQ